MAAEGQHILQDLSLEIAGGWVRDKGPLGLSKSRNVAPMLTAKRISISTTDVEFVRLNPLTRRLYVDQAGHAVLRRGVGADRPEGADYAIIAACVEGCGEVTSCSGTTTVSPGMTFVTLPQTGHKFSALNDSWNLIWCTLSGSDVEEILRSLTSNQGHFSISTEQYFDIEFDISKIVDVYSGEDRILRLFEAAGLGWQLVSKMTCAVNRPGKGHFVSRSLAFINENWNRALSVTDLAERVGVSRSKLAAEFKATTGRSVLSFQVDVRIDRAKKLLETGARSIADVAYLVGYSDPLYFSKLFRKRTGLTPSNYRRTSAP
jgi:AraC family transcriptional regulator, arabinose operon regulatory protein